MIQKLLIALIVLIAIFTAANTYISLNLYKKISLLGAQVIPAGPDNNPQNPAANPLKIEISADDVVKGDKNAPVAIIEFSDFQCPYCGRFVTQTLPQIEEKYVKTGKVKMVFRNYPLPFHQFAQKAAEASLCTKEQGKFWEYHDILFNNQTALSIDNLKQYASKLGLATDKFNQCLDSGQMADKTKKDFEDGVKYGVEGTPAFFINGELLVGAQPFSAFEQIIEKKLNEAKP